jgi:hypothetical protein
MERDKRSGRSTTALRHALYNVLCRESSHERFALEIQIISLKRST